MSPAPQLPTAEMQLGREPREDIVHVLGPAIPRNKHVVHMRVDEGNGAQDSVDAHAQGVKPLGQPGLFRMLGLQFPLEMSVPSTASIFSAVDCPKSLDNLPWYGARRRFSPGHPQQQGPINTFALEVRAFSVVTSECPTWLGSEGKSQPKG